ncbi:hypothetical protein [Paenibacillus pabuli]|uniref:hypothetical protein n=1 Tax=Paenibacillus pabuli TaxID=1472 RepID=UPI001FFEFAF8|nr:hypothetical protein [Paenibacillus pabuli]UPK44965.1 hypothetical protein KET34_05515 [Paenibacillus pabuli]
MEKKRLFLFILLLMLIVNTACDSKSGTTANQYKDEITQNNSIFLYNISQQQMGTYDKDSFQWSPLYEQDNLFQYVFDHASNFVVSGHSIDNEFVLLQVSNDQKKINKIFDLNNDKDCFFPLAHDGKKYYYVLYEDEKNTEDIKRSIVTIDQNNNLQKIVSTNEMITSGVIIDETLYYTVYKPEKENYTVYSMLLEDNSQHSMLIKEGLETRELYKFKDKLFFSSESKIYNDEKSFDKKHENYFVNNLLIQIYSDSNNDMICSVINAENKEVLDIYKNPINFEIHNNTLYIYCEGGIYTLEIGG